MMKIKYKFLLGLFSIVFLGFIIPEDKKIPVSGATKSDWNKDSFWYEPWGTSGVHKGVDIFADKGTPVIASTNMIILYKNTVKKRDNLNKGGNIIIGLGSKWRLHYFAHLDTIEPNLSLFTKAGKKIGAVGDSGNAKGKQPHLHFSILSLIPQPWLIDSSTQAYKKAFYINPIKYITDM